MTPPRVARAFLRGHNALGLALLAFLYLLAVSGVAAMFADELRRIERADAPTAAHTSPQAFARAAAEALARGPGGGGAPIILTINGPDAHLPWLRARIVARGAERQWIADPRTGALVSDAPTPATDFVVKLHTHLHLPDAVGVQLVGMLGVGMVAIVVSGVLAHRRIVRDAFRLRRGGSARTANADLHNRIGTWALPFHLVSALSGAFLGLAGLIAGVLALVAYDGDRERAIAVVLGPQPTADRAAAPLPDLAGLIAAIERQRPGARVRFVGVQQPGTRGQTAFIDAHLPGELAASERWHFTGRGTPAGVAGYATGSAAKQVFGAMTPLHFGNFGGLGVKLLWALLGASMALLCTTGGFVLLARRLDAGRPAPRLAAAWRAWIWGVPGGVLAAAAASVLPIAPPFAFSAGALLAVIVRLGRGARAPSSARMGNMTTAP